MVYKQTLQDLLTNVIGLCAIPAISMALGSTSTFCLKPTPQITSGLQHFAAGVIFSAVAVELTPVLNAADSHWQTAGLVLGFLIGVAVMILIGWFVDEKDEEEETISASPSSLPYGSVNNMDGGNDERSSMLKPIIITKGVVSRGGRRRRVKSEDGLYPAPGQIPWNIVVAVACDALVDGLLIGITFVAGSQSGVIMTVALTIEALFLGLSTGGQLREDKVPTGRSLVFNTVLPLFIIIGGMIGAVVLHNVVGGLYVAVVAFGVAALLYLVVEELMIEAHDDPVADTWVVTLQFFLGFLLILLLHKVFQANTQL